MSTRQDQEPHESHDSSDADRSRSTTSTRIVNPRVQIGSESFAREQIASADIHIHEDTSLQMKSASLTLNPPFDGRWNYHAEVKIYSNDDLVLTGLCSEVRLGQEGGLQLECWGSFWHFDKVRMQGFGTFGMTNIENLYWVVKLMSPNREPDIEGLELDDTPRPFTFAIPLNNLQSSGMGGILTTDTGIASHEYDNAFGPILEQFTALEEESAWRKDNPKLFGVVIASNLLRAEYAARRRAELVVGIINLSLRTGMSHFETRYSAEPLTFDAERGLTPVSLHPWIIVRETSQVKGWVRKIPALKVNSEINLEDSMERIRLFLSEFHHTIAVGDIHDQLGKREMSPRERRLSVGARRAVRWLDTASGEEEIRDQFAAIWIALEAILNAIRYPGVFDGQRAEVRNEIKGRLRGIALPPASQESLAITINMLENRILQNSWSLSRKLRIFSESLGISITPDDRTLVRKLNELRNIVFHEGEDSPSLSQEQVNGLRYLVERMIVAVSIGGYEDLEDSTYEFHIGPVEPEGGAAPITIDGKEDVPYEFRLTKNKQGQFVGEWIAEGKIYSDKNIEIVDRQGH